MKDSDKTSQQLSAYLDGELSSSEARKLERAIGADPALAAQLRELEAVRDLVGDLPREQAGDEFVATVMAQAERLDLVGNAGHAAATESGPRLVRWLASAAVILIAVGVAAIITVVLNPSTWKHPGEQPDGIVSGGELARSDAKDIAGRPGTAPTVALKPSDSATPENAAGSARSSRANAESLGDKSDAAETEIRGVSTEGLTNKAKGEVEVVAGAAASPSPEPELAPDAVAPDAVAMTAEEAPTALRMGGSSGAGVPVTGRHVAPELAANDVVLRSRASRGAARGPLAMPANTVEQTVLAEDIELTRVRVEKLLVSNSLTPYRPGEDIPVESATPDDLQRQAAVAPNYRFARRIERKQIQYFAYVTPSQMSAIVDELDDMAGHQAETLTPALGLAKADSAAPASQPASQPAGPTTRPRSDTYLAVREVNGKLILDDSAMWRYEADRDKLPERTTSSADMGVAFGDAPTTASRPGHPPTMRALRRHDIDTKIDEAAEELQPLLINIEKAPSAKPSEASPQPRTRG